jgi:hypothetical protein
MSKQPEQLSPDVLRQFTGSENWYRGCINRRILFTDGAKHVADCGGAYWLLDEIALAQLHVKAVKAERFHRQHHSVAERILNEGSRSGTAPFVFSSRFIPVNRS